MAWISVHEGVDGPKLRHLYKKLKCSKFEALGILNFLWFWGLTNADKDGLIRYADREDIARYIGGAGAGSKLSPETIVEMLFESGWLDETSSGICIHDWETWQEQWYKAKERRESDADRKRQNRAKLKLEKGSAPVKPSEDNAQNNDAESDPPKQNTADAPDEPKFSQGFTLFWDVYPRKIGKGEAYKKYKARRNDGYSDDELIQAAKAYAGQCLKARTEKEYIKHPKTFLSDSLPFLDFLPSSLNAKPQEPEEPDMSNPFAEFNGS